MDGLLPVSAACIAAAVLALWRILLSKKPSVVSRDAEAVFDAPEKKNPYDTITALPNFDWASTPPIRIRAFKPKYHMTMALERFDLSELIEVDNTFRDRMRLRRSLLDRHPEGTRQCNKVADSAVLELHDWMASTYLPKRFPTIFELAATPDGPTLYNKVSGSQMSIRQSSPIAALDALGEHVDTDFLILLPGSEAADGSPIYHLEAFVTCFPSGFSTREKCGKPLAAIHAPVPGYASKLEKSMDRFFAKLECGKAVKRSNWSITTNDQLYSEGGNHMYADEKQETPVENAKTLDVSSPRLEEDIKRQRKEVMVDDCRLRCERQTLHRLPKTKALVFAFKTYLYKLSEIKEEGLGEELAQAIDGLGQGNVPAIKFYKRGVVWGDKVKEYLRS